MVTGPLVLVRWHDAVASEQWTALDDVPTRPVRVRSVGWLHKKTKRALVLLTSWTDDGHASFMVIPRDWIDEVRELVTRT